MTDHDRDGSRGPDHDAEVQRAWRRASAEQPSAAVDAALIVAARKSVAQDRVPAGATARRKPSPSWWTKWQPLAAAAAVAGIAFVLVPLLPRNHPLAPPAQREMSMPAAPAADAKQGMSMPAAPAADPQQGMSMPAAPTADAQQGMSAPAPASRSRNEIPAPPLAHGQPLASGAAASDVAASAEASAVAPQAPGGAATRGAVIGERKALTDSPMRVDGRSTAASAAPSAEAPQPRADAAAAPSSPVRQERANVATPSDASTWITEIVALYDAGDLTAAADALRAFRRADPDADSRLPGSLRAWARTVQ